MKQVVKIAIVGAGLMGRRHIDVMNQLTGVDIDAVVDPSAAARDIAAQLDKPCFATLAELFANRSPDGVIIATPTLLHVEQALECVRQKIPVLVEKPLASAAKEAAVLVAQAEHSGVPLLVGHHRRYNPLVQKAREVIESGDIGKVRAVHANCWFYKPDNYFEENSWRKQASAGPISVNLVHDIDLLRHLCGEVASVQAQCAPSARGFETEDVAAAVIKFHNGAIGTITVSDSVVAPWSWEHTAHEYPIYPPTLESCYMIGGSHGSLSVPDLRLWTHPGDRDWWSPIGATTLKRDFTNPLVNQIEHFAMVIAGEATPLVSGREGLRTLQVIEAIHNACRTGEVVHIADDHQGAEVDCVRTMSQQS